MDRVRRCVYSKGVLIIYFTGCRYASNFWHQHLCARKGCTKRDVQARCLRMLPAFGKLGLRTPPRRLGSGPCDKGRGWGGRSVLRHEAQELGLNSQQAGKSPSHCSGLCISGPELSADPKSKNYPSSTVVSSLPNELLGSRSFCPASRRAAARFEASMKLALMATVVSRLLTFGSHHHRCHTRAAVTRPVAQSLCGPFSQGCAPVST